MWTVSPIVTLPFNATCNWWYSDVVKSLGVVIQPTIMDVKRNITNIARTCFSDFKLFDNYSVTCKPSKTSTDLMDVMIENLTFLSSRPDKVSDQDCNELSHLSCIPVYAKPHSSVFGTVLVQPCHVLAGGNVDQCYPFLHCLPPKLLCVTQFLQRIGVKSSLELGHIRLVLEMAHKASEELELDINTGKVVTYCVTKLYSIIKELKNTLSESAIAKELQPLYLPSSTGKLHLSSQMLYCNSNMYRNVRFDLTGTGLSQLHLPVTKYSFSEEEFYHLLPADLRPKDLSQCCEQKLAEDCEEVAKSGIAECLKLTFELEDFSNAIMKLVMHQTHDDQLCQRFRPALVQFVRNIHVHQVRNLQTTFTLKEQGKVVGLAKVDFHLQQDGTSYHFYIDSNIKQLMIALTCEYLAEYLISTMLPLSKSTSHFALTSLKRILTLLLRAETHVDLCLILNREGIKLDSKGIQFESLKSPKLGQPVPQTWHHRLDQDLSNIFAPEEWVGYEEREGHIIFAQVAYQILLEDEDLPVFQMRYLIFTREDDEEGKEVTALDIYKFLRGLKPATLEPADTASRDVVPYVAESDSVRVREALGAQERADLKEVKKSLCKELLDIWKLPQKERDKAIKRLYLKWHPDKNPDQLDFAEEVFKFLKRQVERLQEGKALEDPNEDTVPVPTARSGGYHSEYWSSYFREWDNTARNHHSYWRSEHNYRRHHSQPQQNPFDNFMHQGPNERPEEAKRWVRQAEVDYRALCILLDQVSTFREVSGNVCFMAHQVVEKALKGGMYAVCGLGERTLKSHNLPPLAYALEGRRQELQGRLAHLAIPLEPYYLDTRYPNRHPLSSDIPSSMYSPDQAQQAKEAANIILDLIKNIVL